MNVKADFHVGKFSTGQENFPVYACALLIWHHFIFSIGKKNFSIGKKIKVESFLLFPEFQRKKLFSNIFQPIKIALSRYWNVLEKKNSNRMKRRKHCKTSTNIPGCFFLAHGNKHFFQKFFHGKCSCPVEKFQTWKSAWR